MAHKKRFPSVFNSAEDYEAFKQHLSAATLLVRTGAWTGLFFKSVFGENLKKIPILSKLNGPIMALVAMHNSGNEVRKPGSRPQATSACDWSPDKEPLDLVIAGSGPGGAVTALYSVQAGQRVLGIELGTEIDSTVPHHTPEQMRRFFRFGGQEIALNLSPLPYAQGMAWGGGSSINSGLYHRLPKSVLPSWLEATKTASESDFETAAKEIEEHLSISAQKPADLGVYANSPIMDIGTELNWAGGIIPRWRTYKGSSFKHHDMSETYLAEAEKLGLQKLLDHQVSKFKVTDTGVEILVRGSNCNHRIHAKNLCLAAGVIGTPEILRRSKIASWRSFRFGFHAMMREAAHFKRPVNDLHDIDPHQVWSPDSKRKIGAAVGTPALLASTLATKNVQWDGDLASIGTYYISTPFKGKSGLLPLGKNLTPFFALDTAMKDELSACSKLLRESLKKVGGTPLGDLNSSISTVHVFGSLPLGNTKVLDEAGNVAKTGGRVFVRDASILPTAPLVNPQGPLMQLVTVLERQRLA